MLRSLKCPLPFAELLCGNNFAPKKRDSNQNRKRPKKGNGSRNRNTRNANRNRKIKFANCRIISMPCRAILHIFARFWAQKLCAEQGSKITNCKYPVNLRYDVSELQQAQKLQLIELECDILVKYATYICSDFCVAYLRVQFKNTYLFNLFLT